MARYSKTLTPAAQAAFLAALRGGALVEAAAASVGVAISSLYCRRRRDPAFDLAWIAAAEASAGWEFRAEPGERGRLVRAKRRLRFAGRRREAYLAGLERTCNTTASAGDALVHPSTVRRHLRRHPAFAGDQEAALERGYENLEALAAEERAAARRRGPIIAAEGTRPPADFDEQIRILRLYRRRPPRRRGKWRDRQRAAPSFEQ
ncbi:MAG TPA: hypothetical protein VK403_06740, partial [Allosphingosinicella sp.]|nr:hypothetical protein [Allosphingosinicella sp.]